MSNYITPVAVIIGSIVIGAAIFFQGGSATKITTLPTFPAVVQPPAQPLPTIAAEELRRMEGGHVYGNRDAKITVVEFSDLECPFCARLHPTLKRLVDESDGAVNWEYRHLPLPNHANARTGAIASECVAKYAGNDGFFKYLDRLFATIGMHSDAFHRAEALALGVKSADYDACITDPSVEATVDSDLSVAQKAGGSGTPYSIIIKEDKSLVPVTGAQPYEYWIQRIN